MTLKYIWRSFQPMLSFPRPFQQSLACFRVARSPSNSWASCIKERWCGCGWWWWWWAQLRLDEDVIIGGSINLYRLSSVLLNQCSVVLGKCVIFGFWGLRPHTPTGALPLDPAGGLPSPRPPVPTLPLNPGYATGHIYYIVLCSPLVALQWYRNRWPWMTLNDHFALKSVSGSATNVLACPAFGQIWPWRICRHTVIFGGMNKKLLKHVFGLYSLPIIFSKKFSRSLCSLHCVLSSTYKCNMCYQPHLYMYAYIYFFIFWCHCPWLPASKVHSKRS